MTEDSSPSSAGPAEIPERPALSTRGRALSPAARRALAEAEARRAAAAAIDDHARHAVRELQGPKGPEPTRYGDWENKGIASDF